MQGERERDAKEWRIRTEKGSMGKRKEVQRARGRMREWKQERERGDVTSRKKERRGTDDADTRFQEREMAACIHFFFLPSS